MDRHAGWARLRLYAVVDNPHCYILDLALRGQSVVNLTIPGRFKTFETSEVIRKIVVVRRGSVESRINTLALLNNVLVLYCSQSPPEWSIHVGVKANDVTASTPEPTYNTLYCVSIREIFCGIMGKKSNSNCL